MERLTRNWWTIAARGALAFVLGLALVTNFANAANVGEPSAGPAPLFAFFVLGMSCIEILGSLGEPTDDTQGFTMLADGIGGLVLGGLALLSERAQAHFGLVAAAWACLTAIFALVSALDVRRHLHGERVMLMTSIVSGLAAFALAFAPSGEPAEVRVVAGTYALLLGILLVAFAARVRGGGEIHFGSSHPA